MAIFKSKNAGTYRSLTESRSTRSSAAGDIAASQRPPSDPKHFCGAK